MVSVDKASNIYANTFDAVSILAAIATIIVGGVYAGDNKTDMSILLACLPIYWVIQGLLGFASRMWNSRWGSIAYTVMVTLGMLFLLGVCVAFASYRNRTLDKVLDLDSKTSTGFFYRTYQAFRDYTKLLAGFIGASSVFHAIMVGIMGYYFGQGKPVEKGAMVDMGNLAYDRGSGISAAYAAPRRAAPVSNPANVNPANRPSSDVVYV